MKFDCLLAKMQSQMDGIKNDIAVEFVYSSTKHTTFPPHTQNQISIASQKSSNSDLLNDLDLLHSQTLLLHVTILVVLDLFVGNSSDIKSPVFTIEILRDLFEWGVASLDEEQVDDPDFEGKEDAVADIVLPLECLEGDGIDVLV